MLKKITMLLCMVFFVGTMVSCEGGGSNNEPYDPSTNEGSSTTAGNPLPLIISIENASALLLKDQASNNFVKLVGNELQPVFETNANFDEGKDNLQDMDTPSVDYFVQGPNGEIIFKLKDQSIQIDENLCSFIYYVPSTDKASCIQSGVIYEDVGNSKFDVEGRVYFHTNSILKSWDPKDGSTRLITNENIRVDEWIVHADGTVFMTGSSAGITFFRSIGIDNRVQDFLLGNQSCSGLKFVDKNHILFFASNLPVDGETANGYFLLAVSGPDAGKMATIIENEYGKPSEFQRGGNGVYYDVIDTNIAGVFPGPWYTLPMDATGIGSFHIMDYNVYAIAQRDTKHALLLAHLDNNDRAVDLLGDKNIEIYNFVVLNDTLAFDGLNLENNQIVFGAIDLNNRTVNMLDSLDKKLLQFEVRKPYFNESFLDIEDARDYVKKPWTYSTRKPKAFEGLTNIRAIKSLNGSLESYLAVIADRNIYFIDVHDANNPNVLSSVNILPNGSLPLEYHIEQDGNCIFVPSNVSSFSVKCINVHDIMNPILVENNLINFSYYFIAINNIIASNAMLGWLWNYTNPEQPLEIESFTDKRDNSKQFTQSYFLTIYYTYANSDNSLIYILAQKRDGFDEGIFVFDVSDQQNIKLISFEPFEFNAVYSRKYQNYDNKTYVNSYGHLSVIKTDTNGSAFSSIYKGDICSNVNFSSVSEGQAFAYNNHNIIIMDLISNEANPICTQIIDIGDSVEAVEAVSTVDGFTVYVGSVSGLEVVDIVKL